MTTYTWTDNAMQGGAACDVDKVNSNLMHLKYDNISIPPGAIFWFAAATVPDGFFKCNGAAVSRANYNALFSLIGTTYGAGDDSTTFNLPDLRGEFVRCWDDGKGVDPGRQLGQWQNHQFEDHIHHISPGSGNNDGGSGDGARSYSGSNTTIPTSGNHGSETRPRNIALLACIKY